MKITPELVKLFEDDQRSCSTEVAIHNLLVIAAVENLKDLGIAKVTFMLEGERVEKK